MTKNKDEQQKRKNTTYVVFLSGLTSSLKELSQNMAYTFVNAEEKEDEDIELIELKIKRIQSSINSAIKIVKQTNNK